jgi:hypothetical protein
VSQQGLYRYPLLELWTALSTPKNLE